MTDVSPNNTSNSSRGTVYENGVIPVLDARFECPICLNCLKDPILTTCGHRFCKECIHGWLKHTGGSCPLDGQSLSWENDLFPDNYTRREISQQRVQCPVEDCTEILPLIDAEYHVANCHQTNEPTNLQCTFSNVGCDFIPSSMNHLKTHLEKELHNHLALITAVCSGLTNRIAGSSYNNSLKSKAEESKFWDPKPKDQNDSTKPEGNNLQQLIRDLFEKVVLLEQKNREQEIQLQTLQQQTTKLVTVNKQLTSDLSLRICNGEYIWSIPDFPTKLDQMRAETGTMFYSPGFYTSYCGYRFCARINLNFKDPNYLTLNVHLMQGDNDCALEWPFSGRISLILIHPTDPNQSIRETMMSKPRLEAFKRPTAIINPRAFGYAEFISVTCTEQYLKNDSLTVKIQIKTV
ncbi:TNF-receptor-associated factor 6 [Lycorma delicatula]|uniref:TNF-receptor-associated factor 6 n=1 Tax=Lycorma delicatula TaxID=130591 RepID=UPI003F512B8D